jgi:hypothetical protein
VDALLERRCEATEAMLTRLAAERDRIDAQIRDLTTTRERLDAVIAAASRPTPLPPDHR